MPTNPYRPIPPKPTPEEQTSVDRVARAELASTIQRFLSDETNSVELDNSLDDFIGSGDSAVDFVRHELWCLYDEKPHYVTLTREQWNYVQRLLLLLKSDHQLTSRSEQIWSPAQAVALLALLAFGCTILLSDWSQHLVIAIIPLAILTMRIAKHRASLLERQVSAYHSILVPFATFESLHRCYKNADFEKQKYRPELGARMIRSETEEALLSLTSLIVRSLFSPIELLFQTMPVFHREVSTAAEAE